MSYICSVAYICESFELTIGDKFYSLKEKSLLILNHNIKAGLVEYTSKLKMVDLDKKVCMSFFNEVCNESPEKIVPNKTDFFVDFDVPSQIILSLFEVIKQVNSEFLFFKEKLCVALLAAFKNREYVISFLINNMNSFSSKVASLISLDIERKWYLNDVARLMHLSDSLIKRRLRDEGTSFSEILRGARMRFAKNLISLNIYTVNVIAKKCGYNSTSYFVSSFKEYYGVTPCKYFEHINK
ncbi:helix-turn-helix domain-containing protein [Escherichia coli]|uniref:helix-turn-helix domain-containing protein n=2 Tax=Escherichia coli TaxID=562 RepID=UPI0028782AB7|nr:helix-turn-helix domain-containing protein [Escherichia coli]MDS1605235.1 helix-turn-helix domain-containing protein [Escherichia coli]MDS1642869.1 helix-turn-helix domain-containing protein [Escherichia coli]